MALQVHVRALHRAAEILGGTEKLREQLGVGPKLLDDWLAGRSPMPYSYFLIAVDIISSAPMSHDPTAIGRARELRKQSEIIRARAAATRGRAMEVQAAILANRLLRSAGAPPTALAFLQATYRPAEGKAMVDDSLGAAISSSAADMGTVHLATQEGLRLVAHSGFEAPFVEFFDLVTDGNCACGVAAKERQRVIVDDVASDPIFAGKRSGEVMREAGAHAEQSTPLFGQSGVIGVFSTHYQRPRRPSARELDLIDSIAHRTAFWLDGGSL
jgi:hypothetical protein